MWASGNIQLRDVHFVPSTLRPGFGPPASRVTVIVGIVTGKISATAYAVAMLLLATGCNGSAEIGPVQDVTARFESALTDNDGPAACALLAAEAVRRLHDLRPEGCAQALPTLALPASPPSSTQVWGDTAQVQTTTDTVFLRRFPDGWRIIGAGCTPRDERPYQCKVDGT
jgi:hypothetical protein